MTSVKRILMPTDGSSCSRKAIRDGLGHAKELGAEVIFLSVVEDPLTPLYPAPYTHASSYRPQLYQDLKEAAQHALKQAQQLAEEAGVRYETVLVEHQHPVEAIHVAERSVDLVVMGTHGRRGFNRFLFGSVAEEALHGATKPYLMIRHSDRERAEAEQPSSQPNPQPSLL